MNAPRSPLPSEKMKPSPRYAWLFSSLLLVRWLVSFAADVASAPEGFQRLLSFLRLPGPDFFNSGWFALAVAVLGAYLSARRPTAYEAAPAESQEARFEREAREAIGHAFSSALAFLGAVEAAASGSWNDDLSFFRMQSLLNASRYSFERLHRVHRDSIGTLQALEESYRLFHQMDAAIAPLLKHAAGRPLELAEKHRYQCRILDDLIGRALGIDRRDRLRHEGRDLERTNSKLRF